MTTPKSKRTTSPAFQFYPKDFLSSSKVIRMTATERGIYITLLCVCWLEGGLPDDVKELAKLAGVPFKQFARIWPHNLQPCFTLVRNGRLVNERLEDERRKQAEHRRKNKENAEARWHKGGNATASQSHQSGNASLIASASASASPKNTHIPRGPLHTTHKTHAHCGRVCVPGDLHGQFVRSRNHDDADRELRAWYLAVDTEWSTGPKATANTGGNDYRFWRARFDEMWPDESSSKRDPRRPAWAV